MRRPMTPIPTPYRRASRCHSALLDDRARARARRHRDGLEHLRVDRDRRQRRAAAARGGAELRDGAGRRLRRGQRDRSRPSPLSQRAAGQAVGSKDAAAATAAFDVLVGLFPTQQLDAAAALRHVAGRGPGHASRRESGRNRRRRGGSDGDARRTRQRRPLRPVHPGDRDDAGRVAANPAAVRAGSRSVGRERTTVPGPRRRDAPHRRARTR